MANRPDPPHPALLAPTHAQAADIYDTHYRLVVRKAPDYAITTMDPEGIIQTWNDAACQIFGHTEAEVRGRYGGLIFTADDCAAGIPEREVRTAKETGKASDVRWHLRKDGTRFWAESIMTALLDDEGKCVGLAKIVSDATRRKQAEDALKRSEEQFRRLVEQLPLSTQILAPDGSLLQVNHAYEALLGMTAEELRGRNLFHDEQLAATGVIPLLQDALGGATVTGPAVSYVPVRGPRVGQTLWIETTAYPVKDDLGAIREIVVVQNDVTERRYAEEALRHSQKLEGIGVLAGGIAHDFNNMLTGILGNACLAREALTPERARPMLDDVIRASERAADLTRQLMTYAGKGGGRSRIVDLCKAVPEISQLIRSAISRKVSVEFALDGCADVAVDVAQLQQLVMNLVINAAQAYESDSGRVVVRTGRREMTAEQLRRHYASYDLRAGPYVCLEVEDHGVGMDEETQRRIFDPFFTTKSLGRGLGLSAVLGIVRSHGGGLYLTSAPGRGTTFTVLLPPATEPVALDEARAPAEVVRGDGLVLVVDDEPQVRAVAKRSLESAGYTVIEADNGRSALDQLERVRGHVDLVVMDLTMPVMSGGEAIQEMDRRYPGLPVVLMTGLGDPDMISDLTGRGETEYVGKPFTPDGLRRAVKQAKVSRS